MLKPPAWAKGAIPTEKGWVNPKNGELLVSRKLSDRQLTEYWNAQKTSAPAPTPAPAPKPEPIIEADPVVEEAAPTAEPLIEAEPVEEDVDHWSLTKAQLAEHAHAVHGIDLDTSMTKAQMIEELEAQL
jgi:hypothetical protein